MFGHEDDKQDNTPDVNPPIDGAIAPPPPPPAQAPMSAPSFNPALPSPGTDFGAGPTTFSAGSAPSLTAPSVPSPSNSKPVDTNALLDIKQQALGQLSPLIGHLEQSPEEKFRTTMMMIQASDNQDLVKDAYAAAQEITDEKAKAQALLDIVNEINYFTQHHQG